MATSTVRTDFKVGDLITYPGFPDVDYKVTKRHAYDGSFLYCLVDAHHCTINWISLTGCKLAAR